MDKNGDDGTAPDPLSQDVQQFQDEKEKVRQLIGQIGGKKSRKGEYVFHYLLFSILLLLFGAAVIRHVTGATWAPPPLLSLEMGVLLVSIKIIWMLHKQTQVAHFQFWILNTIEFRTMDTSKRLRRLEKSLIEKPKQDAEHSAE